MKTVEITRPVDEVLEIQKFINVNMSRRLPISVDQDKDYIVELKSVFDNYLKQVDKAKFLVDQKDLINEVCTNIINALEFYQNGLLSKAYQCICDLFTEDKLGASNYIRLMREFSEGTEHKTLYKGRVADDISELGEMFHRPFSQRAYMGTERYSIPGLPCLYLAGSVYTCWREIGKPDFKDFYVSRYEANDGVCVLDLAITPIYDTISEYGEETACVLWPLVCAISYYVKEKGRTFKSEYIIPQLLMQMVIENENIHGIRYLSVYTPQKNNRYIAPVYINYAFPAPYSGKGMYSEKLASMFKLTSPICMNEMLTLSQSNLWTVTNMGVDKHGSYRLEEKYQNIIRRYASLNVGFDKITEYGHTAFFDVEEILYRFEARTLM